MYNKQDYKRKSLQKKDSEFASIPKSNDQKTQKNFIKGVSSRFSGFFSKMVSNEEEKEEKKVPEKDETPTKIEPKKSGRTSTVSVTGKITKPRTTFKR